MILQREDDITNSHIGIKDDIAQKKDDATKSYTENKG